ncbi:MAG: peptide-methionine (S)-S-oxide reductase, partial [Bacteroidota bacterium]
DAQAETAHAVIAEIEAAGIFENPIVTQVQPAPTFYEAEDYHQDYFEQNPRQPYCAAVIAPKVAKFRKQFLDKLAEPA